MTPEQVTHAVKAERENCECMVLQYGGRLSALPHAEALLQRLLEVPGAEDVQGVNISADYLHDERTEVDLYLSKKDSVFPREVVKALGIRLEKSAGSDTITCRGEVDGMSLLIFGYLPESCAIVYETVEVPARQERRPRVVCAGGKGNEPE